MLLTTYQEAQCVYKKTIWMGRRILLSGSLVCNLSSRITLNIKNGLGHFKYFIYERLYIQVSGKFLIVWYIRLVILMLYWYWWCGYIVHTKRGGWGVELLILLDSIALVIFGESIKRFQSIIGNNVKSATKSHWSH